MSDESRRWRLKGRRRRTGKPEAHETDVARVDPPLRLDHNPPANSSSTRGPIARVRARFRRRGEQPARSDRLDRQPAAAVPADLDAHDELLRREHFHLARRQLHLSHQGQPVLLRLAAMFDHEKVLRLWSEFLATTRADYFRALALDGQR